MEAPSVLRARARNPPPPVLRTEGGKTTLLCLHQSKTGGGGLRRSRKTEGALGVIVLEALGALLREAFIVFEADDEPAEAGPTILWRAA